MLPMRFFRSRAATFFLFLFLFAGAGSYASAQAFTDGFVAAIAGAAALSLAVPARAP